MIFRIVFAEACVGTLRLRMFFSFLKKIPKETPNLNEEIFITYNLIPFERIILKDIIESKKDLKLHKSKLYLK